MVILPKTTVDGAQHLAEKIRSVVLLQQIPHADSPISSYITLSLGFAQMIPNKLKSSADFVTLAKMLLVPDMPEHGL